MMDFINASIDAQAKRLCYEMGLTEYDDFLKVRHYIAYREFMREIEPLNKIKANIYALLLPKITIYDYGSMNVEYELSEGDREVIAQADEIISEIAARYGLQLSSPTRPQPI